MASLPFEGVWMRRSVQVLVGLHLSMKRVQRVVHVWLGMRSCQQQRRSEMAEEPPSNCFAGVMKEVSLQGCQLGWVQESG